MNNNDFFQDQKKLTLQIKQVLNEWDNLKEEEIALIQAKNKDEIDKLLITQKNIISKFKNDIITLENEANLLLNSNTLTDAKTINSIKYIIEKISAIKERLNNPIELSKPPEPTISVIEKPKESNISIIEKEKPVSALTGKSTINNKTKKSFEFKLGVNALYIIGVVLILISLITFGRYVYVNVLSDLMKGLMLFLLSGLCLLAGQTILKSKKSWFSTAAISIGVSGLYISTIINYLFLNTINGLVALVLTVLITGFSMFISLINNSNLVRIITLLGSYLCLLPLEPITSTGESFILVLILILITSSNVLLPISKEIKFDNLVIPFEGYSSLISLLFYLIFDNLLDVNAVILLSISYIAIYNFVFFKYKGNKSILILIMQLMLSLTAPSLLIKIDSLLLFIIIYIIIASIQFVSFYCCNNFNIKWGFYCQGIITAFWSIELLCSSTFAPSLLVITILFITLLLGSTLIYFKSQNTYTKVTFMILYIIASGCYLFTCCFSSSLLIISLCTIANIIILLILSLLNKNMSFTIIVKYFNLFSLEVLLILSCINSNTYFTFANIILFTLLVAYIFIVAINLIPVLTSKSIKLENTTTLIILTVFTVLFGFYGDLNFYVTSILLFLMICYGLSNLFIDINKSNTLFKNKPLLYSILTTYCVFRLQFLTSIGNSIGSIVVSILLMLIAYISVHIGFKKNLVTLRRYGLGLSLFICAKLIFADFYFVSFEAKTALFLVVGILALIISYIYQKLEKDLNK